MVTIAHLADAHLGFRQYGLPERASDFAKSFHRAVDEIVERRADIDLVLIVGDLFHSKRPSPETIREAVIGLKKLREANIPVIVTRGNHDAPYSQGSNNVLTLLSELGLVKYIDYGRVEISGIEIIACGCTPTAYTRALENYLRQVVSLEKGQRILLLHQVIEGIEQNYPNDPYVVPLDVVKEFATKFNYIALGHVHTFALKHPQLPAYYSGSLDIWDISEFETYIMKSSKTLVKERDMSEKGFLIVHVDGGIEVERVRLRPSRRMIRAVLAYSNEVKPSEVMRDLISVAHELDREDAVVVIELLGNLVPGSSRHELNLKEVRKYFRRVLKLDIRNRLGVVTSTTDGKVVDISSLSLESLLRSSFLKYFSNVAKSIALDPQFLSELAMKLLDLLAQGKTREALYVLYRELGVDTGTVSIPSISTSTSAPSRRGRESTILDWLR
ncbi:MAG: hypothetical protein DRJ40_07810 [Thermoprotei archaeon]|nr:MAG: hypothetical protein DRJ40_07810 [Thermoprotei archaeon]